MIITTHGGLTDTTEALRREADEFLVEPGRPARLAERAESAPRLDVKAAAEVIGAGLIHDFEDRAIDEAVQIATRRVPGRRCP